MSDEIVKPSSRTRGPDGQADLVELLGKVAREDRDAFGDLYRRTSAKLFGTCLRILSDRQEAEDALQATYLSIWRNAARFDPSRGSPMTWLITAARNRAIDRLRASRMIASAPIDEARYLPDAGPIASELAEAASEARRLRGCMDRLESRDAELLRAAFFQGSSYSELATRSVLPLGTVKSRVRRALLKLKDCLA